MKLLMHSFEVWVGNMSINLSGRNVTVAEQRLYGA